MMEDDDDFTFPTVAAAQAPEGQPASRGPVVELEHRLLQLPPLLPDHATAASPLWPFVGSVPKTAATPEEEAPVSGSTGHAEKHRARAEDKEEEPRVAADEERMDLLWEGGCHAHAHAHAEPPPKQQPQQRGAEAAAAAADDDDDKRRAAAVADAERMDKLWESFNEELLLLRQREQGRDDPVAVDHWYLCDYAPSDDAGSEETSASSPAERRGYGCAPTMLRASSRAGGAGQFCSSPRSRRRRGGGAAAGWALLLRLFRRLFAVDKTSSAPSRSRGGGGIYLP